MAEAREAEAQEAEEVSPGLASDVIHRPRNRDTACAAVML
jgi:hypothetical protein